MNETEARLKTKIDALLAAAEKTNAEEDAQYGKNRRGDELQRRESRIKKIAEVTQETNDKKQLLPMIEQIETNLEQKPEKVSAGTGYFSEANVTDQSVKEVDPYVATGLDKHGEVVEPNSNPPPGALPKEAMRKRCEPRLDAPCTRCARRSSSRSSDKSRNSVAFAASACVAKKMLSASGSWCARSATC